MLINYQHKISLSVPLLNEFYLTKLIMTQNYQISVWNRNQIGVITTMSNVLETDAHLGFEAFTVNHFWLGLWSHGLWWKNLCSTWHKESTTYSLVIKICSLEILHGVTEHRRNNHVIILNSWLNFFYLELEKNDCRDSNETQVKMTLNSDGRHFRLKINLAAERIMERKCQWEWAAELKGWDEARGWQVSVFIVLFNVGWSNHSLKCRSISFSATTIHSNLHNFNPNFFRLSIFRSSGSCFHIFQFQLFAVSTSFKTRTKFNRVCVICNHNYMTF